MTYPDRIYECPRCAVQGRGDRCWLCNSARVNPATQTVGGSARGMAAAVRAIPTAPVYTRPPAAARSVA